MSNNYLMPHQWHRLFYYCKSTFFCGMHFCLQYDNYSAYHASIMLDAFRHLLCSKLCQHNRLVPTFEVDIITRVESRFQKLIMYSVATKLWVISESLVSPTSRDLLRCCKSIRIYIYFKILYSINRKIGL